MKTSARSFAVLALAALVTVLALPGTAHCIAVSYTVSGHVSDVSLFNGETPVYSPKVNVGDPFTGILTYDCVPGAAPFESTGESSAMWNQGVSLNYSIDVNHDFGYTPTGFQNCYLKHPSDPAQKDSLRFENTLPGFNGYGKYTPSMEFDPMDLSITYKTNTVFSGLDTPPDSLHVSDIERLFVGTYYQYFDPGTYHSEWMSLILLADSITQTSPAPAPVPEPSTLQLMGMALLGIAGLRRKLMRS